jgi:hypothetical protein
MSQNGLWAQNNCHIIYDKYSTDMCKFYFEQFPIDVVMKINSYLQIV